MCKKSFIVELSKFYKSFLIETTKSIELLKEMQINHPEDYSNWVKVQKDPSTLLEFSNNMDEDSRKTLIDLFVRASTISNKMRLIFEMTPEEKEKFIKEIELFSQSIDGEIKKQEESK